MKLYEYEYRTYENKNKVIIREYEVDEKPKTYRQANGARFEFDCRHTINKSEIDTLLKGWSGYHYYSLNSMLEQHFVKLIYDREAESLNSMLKQVEEQQEKCNLLFSLYLKAD